MRTMLCLLGAAFVLPAWAQLAVENPWSRATPPGATVAAGYMVIRNSGPADRLVGASSPAAARVETHVHIREGDVMRMREVNGYDIPAQGRLELKPGGPHLMLQDIRAPFKEGDRVPLVLRFERAGEMKVDLQVGRLGAPAPGGHRGH